MRQPGRPKALRYPRVVATKSRGRYWAFTVLTIVLACLCVAMAGLQVAALATDGSAVGQDGSSGSNWLWLVVFTVQSMILVPIAIWRVRRAATLGGATQR